MEKRSTIKGPNEIRKGGQIGSNPPAQTKPPRIPGSGNGGSGAK